MPAPEVPVRSMADGRPPVSPLVSSSQANGPTIASALPQRMSPAAAGLPAGPATSQAPAGSSNDRPRSYSVGAQANPVYHNWKLKRALERVSEVGPRYQLPFKLC